RRSLPPFRDSEHSVLLIADTPVSSFTVYSFSHSARPALANRPRSRASLHRHRDTTKLRYALPDDLRRSPAGALTMRVSHPKREVPAGETESERPTKRFPCRSCLLKTSPSELEKDLKTCLSLTTVESASALFTLILKYRCDA